MEKYTQIISDIFRLVKKNICKTIPFLHPLCMSLNYVPVDEGNGKDVLWTDGKQIYYDPSQIIELYQKRNLEQLENILLHILLHGILGHFEMRFGVNNKELFDLCADIEVEGILERLKKRYSGSAETRRTSKQIERIHSCRRGYVRYSQQINNGQANITGLKKINETKYRDNHIFWEQKKYDCQTDDIWENGRESIKVNLSSAEIEWLDSICQLSDDQDGLNEGMNVESRSASKNLKFVEEQDYDFTRILREILEIEEVNREDEEFFDKALYSYGLDTYGDVALLEPIEEEDKQKLDTIVIAIDTSGSCEGELIELFFKETRKLFKDIQTTYTVDNIVILQCDDKIQDEKTYSSIDDFLQIEEIEIKGFGNTDFRPVFERVSEIGKYNKIGCLIYFSDGQGTFPRKETSFKSVMIIDEVEQSIAIPQWIKCFNCREREEKVC